MNVEKMSMNQVKNVIGAWVNTKKIKSFWICLSEIFCNQIKIKKDVY